MVGMVRHTDSLQGDLLWGGRRTSDLAREFGTPLYVMDENMIAERANRYLAAAGAVYKHTRVAYAAKAFLCGAMVRLADQLGLWLDVVSGGELYLALSAGFDPERIIVHGNNKSADELALALEAGAGRIVVDNPDELELLGAMARSRETAARIQLRITPGISADTHKAIRTGSNDSKFGFVWDTGQAIRAVRRAMELEWISLQGFHFHIGSQIRDTIAFETTARVAVRLARESLEQAGYLPGEINLGGGWVAGEMGEEPPPLEDYVSSTLTAFRDSWEAEISGTGHSRWPTIYFEPGRSIVAEAGITLYTVGTIKTVPGSDPYVLVDGGMTDNPRPALYGAEYEAVLANRADEDPTGTYRLAGKSCESGDIIIERACLPSPEPGDLVAVFNTGAYNQSMCSTYNHLPRPAVVFVNNGQARLVVRRETDQDLNARDVEIGKPANASVAAARDHEE